MLPLPVERDENRRHLRFALACRYIAGMDLKHWRVKGRRSTRSAGRAGARWAYTAWRRSKSTFLALGLLFGPAATVGGDIVSYAIVQGDATLRVQGKTIRLFGVYPVDLRGFCDDTFRPVRCQTRAAVALASRIQGFVHCDPEVHYHDGTIGAFCSVEGDGVLDPPVDLGVYLIRKGWAVALPEAPFEYHTLEEIARAHGRGVWGFQADSIIRSWLRRSSHALSGPPDSRTAAIFGSRPPAYIGAMDVSFWTKALQKTPSGSSRPRQRAQC